MLTLCRRREVGSVLLLFPVGVLAVLVLAAVAVDSAIAFLGERELAGAVAAAANDAATDALSEGAFYGRGTVELDDSEVARVAEERVRTSLSAGRYRDLAVQAWVIRPAGASCSWSLRVEASATVGYVFATAIPGAPGQVTVDAGATSAPRSGGGAC
jgi:hypothetical protein